MRYRLTALFPLLLAGAIFTPAIVAQETIGYISYDAASAGNAEFDITNITGINSGLSSDPNPVTSSVSLTGLSLDVKFASGPDEIFGSSYFTLNSDGISWDGTSAPVLSGAISAILTGDFATTTLTLMDGTTVTVDPGFSATISDPGVAEGDTALIVATNGSSSTPPPPSSVPEPESLLMVATGVAGLAGLRRRLLHAVTRRAFVGTGCLLVLVCLLLIPSASQAEVRLAAWTVPSSGLAGFNSVTLTGGGFPTGTISPGGVTLTFAKTCGGAAVATETATTVSTIYGTTDRIALALPASLDAGTYYISLSGSVTSSSCAEITVTHTTATLAACVPTSSLAVTVGTNVNAYVPFGYWDASTTGIEEVPLEGSGTAKSFTTPGVVNSCAANSVTDEVVCTENTNNVDLIVGSALTTIKSGSNTYKSFTGGNCENCGVAINPTNNTALIAMGVTGAASSSGVQVLNLASNTFDTAFPMVYDVSENVSIDSGRGLILSPGEDSVYDLLKIAPDNTLTEYSNRLVGSYDGDLDSAAEDCTTGIALSSDEFSDQIYITDLTQAVFTPGTPGTWKAPGQFYNLADNGYDAGTSGITSAPGTNHLAVVTGEFGGQSYSALLLPSTSGTGTPTLADRAYVEFMPPLPDGTSFSAGYDPHTITAYTSPNSGKSYAVLVDYGAGDPVKWLAVVDLQCVLGQPRTAGTHFVAGTAAACTRYVAVP